MTPAQGKTTASQRRALAAAATGWTANEVGLKSLTLRSSSAVALSCGIAAAGGVIKLTCAPGVWQPGEVAQRATTDRSPRRGGLPNPPVLASGAWVDEATFALRLCYVETPFVLDLAFSFEGELLKLNGKANAGFAATAWPEIVGQKG